jgi:hypothetical protein
LVLIISMIDTCDQGRKYLQVPVFFLIGSSMVFLIEMNNEVCCFASDNASYQNEVSRVLVLSILG